MKKLLPFVTLLVVAYFGWSQFDGVNTVAEVADGSDSATTVAFNEWKSGNQVQGSGMVIRILSDDNEGSRHQRFIVRLNTGQTLLVAHNIDLAPKISSLREGDTVSFNGEYEWNEEGGVVHWTHRDPQRRHVSGWLKHNGQMYQ